MNSAVLKPYLECPVCFQVPKSKIFVCRNSHKVCESCYGKITADAKQCPQGNCPYDDPPRRNRELEAIIENADIEISCSNASAGCTVEMKKEELREHEVNCIFKQVHCPGTNCEKLILFSSIDSKLPGRTYFPHIGNYKSNFTILQGLRVAQAAVTERWPSQKIARK